MNLQHGQSDESHLRRQTFDSPLDIPDDAIREGVIHALGRKEVEDGLHQMHLLNGESYQKDCRVCYPVIDHKP